MARWTTVVKAVARLGEHACQRQDEASGTLNEAAVILEELARRPPTCGQGESVAACHSMEEGGSLEGPFLDRGPPPAIEEGWELVKVPREWKLNVQLIQLCP